MKKNVASQTIFVQMVDKDTGVAFTGTVSGFYSGDGGTQSATSGTGPTHVGNGAYKYVPQQAETNYTHIAFTFTATSAVPATVQVYTGFPQTGDAYPDAQSISARTVTIFADTQSISARTVTTYADTQSISANVVSTRADTQSISANAVTIIARIPTVLIGGRMDANIGSISADTASVARLEFALNTEVLGEATAGSTVSTIPVASFIPAGASAVDDQFVGLVLKFSNNTITAALRGQATLVTDYVHATKLITVTNLTTAPADGDTFVLL